MKLIYSQTKNQDTCQNIIVNELKELGIKVPKSATYKEKHDKNLGTNIFGGRLSQLPQETVLQDGINLQVPRFLKMAATSIRENIKSEGLFRKGGSIVRQKELKVILWKMRKAQSLENGGNLEEANVHDVANLVKQFLRQLAEPLLHPWLYESLLKAHCIKDAHDRNEAIFLISALLSREHLQVLRFVMALFSEVASHSCDNKMDSKNLAIVLTPSLFIHSKEIDVGTKEKVLHKQTGVIQCLIDHCFRIGMVLDHLIDGMNDHAEVMSSSCDNLDDNDEAIARARKIKRNSLNGVFQGLCNLVHQNHRTLIPRNKDQLLDHSALEKTPTRATKRGYRDHETAISQCSSLKKRAMMPAKTVFSFHADSPDPVPSENAISSNPFAMFTPNSNRRKSGKKKIFGMSKLSGRNSYRAPKSAKKAAKKESQSASKIQSFESVRLRPTSENCGNSPILPSKLRQPLAESNGKLVFPGVKEVDNRIITRSGAKLMHSNKDRSGEKVLPIAKSSVIPKISDTSVSPLPSRLWEGNPPRVGANKWQTTRAQLGPVPCAAVPAPLVFGRPSSKRSLRRGRPNTVSSGLPSPFVEADKTRTLTPMPAITHYTSDPGPVLDRTAELKPKSICSRNSSRSLRKLNPFDVATKCGSEYLPSIQRALVFSTEEENPAEMRLGDVFGPEENAISVEKPKECNVSQVIGVAKVVSTSPEQESVPHEEFLEAMEDDVFAQSKLPCMDSDTGMKGDRLESTTDFGKDGSYCSMDFDVYAPPLDEADSVVARNVGSSFEMNEFPTEFRTPVTPSAANASVTWRPAVAVFRENSVSEEHKSFESLGRPSIIQLLKDEAGRVAATARKYDEIASAVAIEQRLDASRSASPLVRVRTTNLRTSRSDCKNKLPYTRATTADCKRAEKLKKFKPSLKENVNVSLSPVDKSSRKSSVYILRSNSVRTSRCDSYRGVKFPVLPPAPPNVSSLRNSSRIQMRTRSNAVRKQTSRLLCRSTSL